MRIKNPNFSSGIDAYVAAKKNAVQAWVAARPSAKSHITPDELRAAFPDDAAQLTDGVISEIAKALGLSVE